jgi:hypothetical protein
MPGVLMPQQKDTLGDIAKGLQIAGSIYGIYTDQRKLNAAQEEADAKAAEEKMAAGGGIDSRGEQALFDKGYIPAKLGTGEVKRIKFGPNGEKTEVEFHPPGVVALQNAEENRAQTKATADALEKYRTRTLALQEARADKDKKKSEIALTPQEKMKKLTSTDKQRLDNTVMATKAVHDMQDALAEGDWTFTLPGAGDNKFTDASRRWVEALGRLQSGGQISGKEAEQFRKLVPIATDDSRMQRLKLENATEEMYGRLSTLGFKPEEIPRIADWKQAEDTGGDTALAAGLPKPGEEHDGYIYTGGDPADPHSWAKKK